MEVLLGPAEPPHYPNERNVNSIAARYQLDERQAEAVAVVAAGRFPLLLIQG